MAERLAKRLQAALHGEDRLVGAGAHAFGAADDAEDRATVVRRTEGADRASVVGAVREHARRGVRRAEEPLVDVCRGSSSPLISLRPALDDDSITAKDEKEGGSQGSRPPSISSSKLAAPPATPSVMFGRFKLKESAASLELGPSQEPEG